MVVAMDTRTRIHERLQQVFDPVVELDVIDQSAEHQGHAGAASGGGHFRVIIVAQSFEGLSPVARQRKVYQALAEEMRSAIHALSMTCLTPSEYEGEV